MLIPTNKNSIALTFVAFITLGFFISGLLDILDYFIVKVLLFVSFGILVSIAVNSALKNDKKNRPKDQLQDDSH